MPVTHVIISQRVTLKLKTRTAKKFRSPRQIKGYGSGAGDGVQIELHVAQQLMGELFSRVENGLAPAEFVRQAYAEDLAARIGATGLPAAQFPIVEGDIE